MTALGEAYTTLYNRRLSKEYERGYAAGWYEAQLAQAKEQAAKDDDG